MNLILEPLFWCVAVAAYFGLAIAIGKVLRVNDEGLPERFQDRYRDR
jgi:hypothetical protein